MLIKHTIEFPTIDTNALTQDTAYFYLMQDGDSRKIRFHDYNEIYKIPGLYEELFYKQLKCQSPDKLRQMLKTQVGESFSDLRVLDLGAGNGMMGEALKAEGASYIVGVDIIPEAEVATKRDRPGIYDGYFVEDFCNLSDERRQDLSSRSINCLTSVAALGFGDIPAKAFIEAFNLVENGGWIAFNIKETFVQDADTSGFSKLVKDLIISKYFDLYHFERYRHRMSLDGEPLYYMAIVGKKKANLLACS